MGSIFSSSHRFSSPVKSFESVGKTLKKRKKALDIKASRKVTDKRRKKERIYKKEERVEKHSYKMQEKEYDRETKKQLKKLEHEHKKELAQSKNKPKYNKWGDRIA